MVEASLPGSPQIGLRERKKIKIRSEVQQHAIRLFLTQGYEATTVQQIADAAEISRSTLFRYFPTKEDLVVADAYDTLFLETVKAQPAELTPPMAVLQTLRAFASRLPPGYLDMERQRLGLIMATPQLRERMLGSYPEALRRIAAMLAARAHRSTDDFQMYLQAGDLLGVGLAAMVAAVDDPSVDYFTRFEAGLSQLDTVYTQKKTVR